MNDSQYIGFDFGAGDLPGYSRLSRKTLLSLWEFDPHVGSILVLS
jgi:hypothetical protein